MNAEPNDVARRKRKAPPRRVATVTPRTTKSTRSRFGLPSGLNHREKEAVKERLAFFGGIGLAIIIAAILGWGVLNDNVIQPMQQRAADAKPVAKVGNYTITTGFFRRFVHFQLQNLQSNITQVQQQITQLQGSKKNAAQLAAAQQELSTLQTQQTTLAQDSLKQLIDLQTALQRHNDAHVPLNTKAVDQQMNTIKKQTGGFTYFQQYLQKSELSEAELRMLVTGQVLEQDLQKKVAKNVNPFQTKVRASHILVKSKSLAEKLMAEVKSGKNFAALAKKYSTDTASAKVGGDLGYFAQHTMVAPFDRAAFSMKAGQVKLVHSQYGWHVIKVTGREKAKLKGAELSTAQQNAFGTWLANQEAKIGVEKFIKPENLPGQEQIPTVSPLTNPIQQPIQQPVAPQPVKVKPKSGTTGSNTTTKPAPGSKSNTKPNTKSSTKKP